MSMDLNINNYSIRELETFFRLESNVYTPSDVELKEYQIRERLLSSGHVDKKLRRDLIEFLKQAKQWLLYTKFGNSAAEPLPSNDYNKSNSTEQIEYQQPPTLIPKHHRLDPIDIPSSDLPVYSRVDDEITKRGVREYTNTFPGEFYQGILNPLNKRVITKCVSIDTRFRSDYQTSDPTDFLITLPSKLHKVVSMQLAALEFPISFYKISGSYGNNFLYLYVNTQYYIGGPIEQSEIIVIIPDGNYTSFDLLDKINSILRPVDASGNILEPDNIFSYVQLSLDVNENRSGTAKVTIEATGEQASAINSIGLDFKKNILGQDDLENFTTKIGWNLGFSQEAYFGATSYTGETTIDMNIMRYIYLSIDDFQRSVSKVFFSAFHEETVDQNTLARISLGADNFEVIMENNYNLVTVPREYYGPVDIQKLRIRLFDDHGRPLKINNANYSFALNFKMLYDM
jgi:hypothetical protein